MTALINDVASHLGCTVGLKDSVTALTFVSLGTSLPGTVSISLSLFFLLLIILFAILSLKTFLRNNAIFQEEFVAKACRKK
jgi:Ca2+/Na+ antiporter